jgi:hypothetical protein
MGEQPGFSPEEIERGDRHRRTCHLASYRNAHGLLTAIDPVAGI